MLEFFIYFYTFYIAVKIYISVMQIGYVASQMEREAVILPPAGYKKAGRYGIKKERVGIVNSLLELALFIFWIGYGLSWMDGLLPGVDETMRSTLLVLVFLGINYLVSLPLDLYTTFKLDKEFGFSNMTPGLFVKDTLKSLALSAVLGGAVIYALVLFIESFALWWVYGFMFIFFVIVLANLIYPTIIAPMFNKFTPMEDSELKEKIEALLARVGFESSGVFVIDSSKRDSRLNAYFGGLGKTKRVVLFDTLIEKISQNELLAVLGHELGHFAHKDILKNIALMGAMIFFLFAFFGNLGEGIFLSLGISQSAHALIALILLFSPALMFFIMPVISFMSRRNEYAADRFGSELAGSREPLADALLKLANENKSFPKSHFLNIFFYHSHPPLIERLKALGCEGKLRGDDAKEC